MAGFVTSLARWAGVAADALDHIALSWLTSSTGLVTGQSRGTKIHALTILATTEWDTFGTAFITDLAVGAPIEALIPKLPAGSLDIAEITAATALFITLKARGAVIDAFIPNRGLATKSRSGDATVTTLVALHPFTTLIKAGEAIGTAAACGVVAKIDAAAA